MSASPLAPARSLALGLLLLLGHPGPLARAEVSLPRIFSDHLVLQRDKPVRVFGFAEPGESVTVSFAGQELETAADAAGDWAVTLEPLAASAESRVLTVRGASNRIELQDVLVGEVWLCSGQSNMVWRVDSAEGAEAVKAGSLDPRLRMFTGALVSEPEPQRDLPGAWKVSGPETVGRFSAVAFYFGRDLLQRLDVPIGLVVTAWGGSNVEAWMTPKALRSNAAGQAVLHEYEQYAEEAKSGPALRAGIEVDDSDWRRVKLPVMFADLGHDAAGVFWFRKQVAVPEAWRDRKLILELGPVDDEDHTYVDGELIGQTGNWEKLRRYEVPASQLATRTLAVRVRNGLGPGGFHGKPETLRIYPEGDESSARSLAGDWRAKLTASVGVPGDQQRASHLYNGMLHPIRRTTVRGAIWYQGENNAMLDRPLPYYELFPAFVRGLREIWQEPELPFYFVQLPNFSKNDNTFWSFPALRDAQLRAYRSLEQVGMAVTIDLGAADSIHPSNKLDVGLRLARWALARTYGMQGIVPSGPIFRSASFENGRAVVGMETFGSELYLKGPAELIGFQLAGEDRVFRTAVASLEEGRLVISSESVPEPIAVRYAWDNDPFQHNLFNAEGLPAAPFRSDDWPLDLRKE